jgi:hypothetical protein
MTLAMSASILSFGSQGDDVTQLHQAIQALGRDLPAAEVDRRVFGAGTAAVVKALQAAFGVADTGIVDAVTVRAINSALAKVGTDARTVRGRVTDADGRLVAGLSVQLYLHDAAGEKVIGKSALDAEGAYRIAYNPPADGARVDLRIEIRGSAGAVETTPPASSILTDARTIEVVDFVVTGATHPPASEYDLLLAELTPLLGARSAATLKEDGDVHEVSLLAVQSGRPAGQIAALAIAARLANETKVPAAALYGLLREGLPADLRSLQSAHPDVQRAALRSAVAKGTVPAAVGGQRIDTFLADLAPAADATLKQLLGRALQPGAVDSFVAQYVKNGGDPARFWKSIAADPRFAQQAGALKLAVQVTVLTENHAPLAGALLNRQDIHDAGDLARLTDNDWLEMIQSAAAAVPDGMPGATPDERVHAWVAQLTGRVEAAFPTKVLAARLGDSPIAAFLSSNPAYDLKTTYPAQFFKQNAAAAQGLNPDQQRQLQAMQRLFRVTGNVRETIALASKGIRSAQQISRLSRDEFTALHQDVLSADRATKVYDRAVAVSATALAIFAENAASMNRTALQALPSADIEKQANLASNSSIPDWETLFGSIDSCSCDDCASVHSAAAYFVDVLHFLDDRDALVPLFARRPDLGDIELSCENTDTPLPAIDLVNEVLADAIAPPPPFVPFDLSPTVEADLNQSVVSSALVSAFHPALGASARIEVGEPGRRWHISDGPFGYVVSKGNNVLSVIARSRARSRQTTGTAVDRRVTPQYPNTAAFAVVAQTVYPWTLPFDVAAAEAKAFLEHLGVPRRALIAALRPTLKPFDPTDAVVVLLACEGLGLTDAERGIVVGEPTAHPEESWGSIPIQELTSVRAFLDRTGLAYADLDGLLATRFVNPGGAVSVSADPTDVDSCDTTKLQINGLTADAMMRLHRFVRLLRKLGWHTEELDRAITALSPDAASPVLTNTTLVRLDHLRALCATLRLQVAEALALWKPIGTGQPVSLYATLFYNAAVFKPLDEALLLAADGVDLADTGTFLADHAGALQAAFRLDGPALLLLTAKTDGALNLANLSLIYRHATLARQLRLSVQSFLTAIDLTGINPFDAAHTEDTVRFVETVTAIRGSSFDMTRLDYLLRHRSSVAASFVPTELALATELNDLRAALKAIDDASGADPATVKHATVVDRMSAALGLPSDATAMLLDTLKHGQTPALLMLTALTSIDVVTLSRGNATAQFETLEKLLKVASVVQLLEVPPSRLDWLLRENAWLAKAPDPLADPIPLASWFSLVELDRLRQDLTLGGATLEAILGALNEIATAAIDTVRVAAKEDFVGSLNSWLGWNVDNVTALIGKADDLTDRGLLGVRFPEDYTVDLITRLDRAVALLKRLGVGALQAAAWCQTNVDNAAARAIRGAAKAKYDDAAWQTIATPLEDSLREQLRDALVAYLIARPSEWATGSGLADPDDLYAHFLIDAQISACQLTSRIKQAIGSVQLFAQRSLMGLEPAVQTSDSAWTRWDAWMKSFRVWEANRKIWLYPENWIEPELRDDKSPFFKDLENELQQSDLDASAAEQAVMHYLEKLDQVSRLEITATFEDADKTLHVFGRTFHQPRTNFYRRREGATESWTPWEKLDIDIQGDHLIPVVWNRKLMLIWPIFTQKQEEKRLKMPAPNEPVASGGRYWELQLAWSEYQYGRWSGKKISEPVRFDATLGDPDVLFGPYVPPPRFASQAVDTGTSPPLPPQPQPQPQPTPGGSTPADDDNVPSLVPAEAVLFKAFVTGDSMTVRGYLRLDYFAGGAGAAFAYPFGEFRFSGCRAIATTAPRSQMAAPSFAAAPQGTRFDAMWLAQSGAGLTMLDGAFAVRAGVQPVTAFDNSNEPEPLPEDVSAINAKRIDIPVLGTTPSRYRLLAPHQDPQFIADRPFFFMDDERAFIVSSTGNSGFVVRPDVWAAGDLATVGMASAPAQPDSGGGTTPLPPRGLTVLVPGPEGTRIARELTPVSLAPAPGVQRSLSRFWTDRVYTFGNFHHPYVCEFVKDLEARGIDGLLSLDTQTLLDEQAFDAYAANDRVATAHPVDDVEFENDGAYALYNWELFFHIPLLIATRLSSNQRFGDAQRWFHYIFDPRGAHGGSIPQRYWRTKPFNERLSPDYEKESVEAIEKLAAEGAPHDLVVAVNVWRDNPFNPYAVARLRTTAFQKTVTMKYLDNLIAWADHLFGEDTIEAINEATQLYVLAGEILGRRAEVIPPRVHRPVQTFNTLQAAGPLSNALEQIELLVPDAADGSNGAVGGVIDPPKVLYFCVQENDRLTAYWSTVADRLFKIRHCMNIEGQVRQLPLFEPPIDPALLVRAQAAGLSLADVLSQSDVTLPNYRFAIMLQKANEVTGEVRNLGAQLLAALEKRDAESLATLRSGQELELLQSMRDVRVSQVDEATANVAALQRSQEMAQARKEYYESRDFMSALEGTAMALSAASLSPLALKVTTELVAVISYILPIFKFGSPTTAGTEVGGDNKGKSSEAVGRQQETAARILDLSSSLTGRLAEYGRRRDEWGHQANLATIELKQIEQQLTAAQIRLAIAGTELRNHDQQIDHAHATDDFLRGKFTNTELYQWMIGQVSALYFQGYQLACDLARRAERCMQFELGLRNGETSFIHFGYWDSLKRGLLAGDRLAYDLKRLDIAFLDGNVREYELTKHVSLLSLAPEQLIALKETGSCNFDIPEWLFDLDTPGHYRRRLKSVAVTVPCVVGPYTTIHCKVQLTRSSYRNSVDLSSDYRRLAPNDPGGPDTRFVDDRKVVDVMVTSSAQNDTGMFETSLRDERYLPFEGAGAISSWRLALPLEFGTFDYDTITDVILHLRYTAREDDSLQGAATASVKTLLADVNGRQLLRLFSLRHEFPTEWHRLVNGPVDATATAMIAVNLAAERFPYFAQRRNIEIVQARVLARVESGSPPQVAIAPGQAVPDPTSADWSGAQSPGPWTVSITGNPKILRDLFLIVAYTV